MNPSKVKLEFLRNFRTTEEMYMYKSSKKSIILLIVKPGFYYGLMWDNLR